MQTPDDFDDLFDLAPAPAPTPTPAAPKSGRPDGVEARKEARVRVKWAARVLQPDGQVVPMQVRDISETGLGLVSQRPISSHTTLRVAVAVPDINTPSRFATVTGSFKTAHVTVSGLDLVYGGVWLNIEGAGRELVRKWIRKLTP